MRDADHLLLPAVVEALGAAELDVRDVAARRLAELLARRIDAAGAAAALADRALRAAGETGDDALVEQVAALKAKLSEQVALATLGARLESVLVQLQATPAARAKAGQPGPPAPGRLDAFRRGA